MRYKKTKETEMIQLIEEALKVAGIDYQQIKPYHDCPAWHNHEGYFVIVNSKITLPLEIAEEYMFYALEPEILLGNKNNVEQIAYSLEQISKEPNYLQ
jgi:hypothetical protein